MDKARHLSNLKLKMEKDDQLPLIDEEVNLVFGVGNAQADIVFIGEAPGFYENRAREPFVGRAGKLLDKLLEKIKISRKDVYITNIVKRRPPQNRDPLPDEIATYKPYLKEELHIIKPKIIATLGRFSMNYFLPEEKISEAHGKIYMSKSTDKTPVLIYPLYHPAAALRSTKMLEALTEDFEKLPKILKKYDELVD